MPEQQYTRLTRWRIRRKGLVTLLNTRASLWIARDHLLNVDSTRLTEEYKRFYFHDIQSITLQRTTRRRNLNIGLTLLLGVVAVLFFLSRTAANLNSQSI